MATADCFFAAPTTAIGGWGNVGSSNSAFCMSLQDGTNRIEMQNDVGATDSGYFTTLDYSAIPAGSIINSVTVKYYEGRSGTGSGTGRHAVKLGATVDNYTKHTFGAAYTLHTEAATRPGGGSWVYADLANVQVRFHSFSDAGTAGRIIRVDQLWLTIDYTPGGLFALVYCLPLIGVLPALCGLARRIASRRAYRFAFQLAPQGV
jgi:hypothetical protein